MIESSENKLTFVVGTERVFPFPIAFYDPGNIDCYIRIDDVERKLAADEFQVEEQSDYSHGANITLLLDPLPTGATLAIIRRIAIEQTLSLPFNGKLPSKLLEQSLDKLTMICQQQQEAISRSLTVGVTDAGYSPETLVENIQQSAREAQANAQASAASATDAANIAVNAEASNQNAVAAANIANRYKQEAQSAAQKATGIPIGTVYPCLGQLPPDGSYLLNGQIIENCRDEHPEFWQWLTGGEAAGIPLYKEFVMPKLEKNGNMGGEFFAVGASASASMLPIYKVFDADPNTTITEAVSKPDKGIILYYYSPKPLQIDHFTFSATKEVFQSFEFCIIYGSNDINDWTTLGSIQGYSDFDRGSTVRIVESSYPLETYKYYRFLFLPTYDYDLYFPEITLHGGELDSIVSGGCAAPQLTNEEYDRQIRLYGVCGGVVIDEDTGSVRLPTWKFQAQLPNTLQARGNGTALGVTDGSKQMGLEMASTALHAYESLYASAAGTVPATKTGGANALALTSDATKSGVVTDVVTAEADMFSWVIQVFNAPIPLSTQQSYAITAILQGKAQTDLGNVAANIDFIVEHEDLADGSWYDLYRSGKVVQGGTTPPVTTGSAATEVAVSMPIEMADTNYQVWLTLDGDDTLAASLWTPPYLTAVKTSVRVFTTKALNSNGLRRKSWLVIGKAAANVKE